MDIIKEAEHDDKLEMLSARLFELFLGRRHTVHTGTRLNIINLKCYHCCACSPIVIIIFFFFCSASCWLLSHPSLRDLFLFCTCPVCYHHMVVRFSVALLCLQTTVLCHIFAAHPVMPSDTYHLFNTLDAKNIQIFFFRCMCEKDCFRKLF